MLCETTTGGSGGDEFIFIDPKTGKTTGRTPGFFGDATRASTTSNGNRLRPAAATGGSNSQIYCSYPTPGRKGAQVISDDFKSMATIAEVTRPGGGTDYVPATLEYAGGSWTLTPTVSLTQDSTSFEGTKKVGAIAVGFKPGTKEVWWTSEGKNGKHELHDSSGKVVASTEVSTPTLGNFNVYVAFDEAGKPYIYSDGSGTYPDGKPVKIKTDDIDTTALPKTERKLSFGLREHGGNRVVFQTEPYGSSNACDLWLMEGEGGTPTRLTESPTCDPVFAFQTVGS